MGDNWRDPLLVVSAIAAVLIAITAAILFLENRFAHALSARSLHIGPKGERLTAGVASVIACIPFLRRRADILYSRARTARMWFTASRFAGASPGHLETTISQLFREIAEGEDRVRWRQWHRVHLPGFIVKASKTNKSQQTRVLNETFAGLRSAIATMKRSPDQLESGKSSPPLTFDSLWPFVEVLEELAVHCRPDLNLVFAQGVTATAAAIDDEALHILCGWAVNELLERGPHERKLGCVIATDLARNGPPTCAEALLVLRDLYDRIAIARGEERREISPDGGWLRVPSESEKGFLDALVKASDTPPGQDEPTDQARHDALHTRPDTVLTGFRAAVQMTPQTEDAKRQGVALAATLFSLCEPIFADADMGSALQGARALASLRFIFRSVCVLLKGTDGVALPVRDAFVEDLCLRLMKRVKNRRVSAFLTIESMEPIRDRMPALVGAAMAKFVGRENGRLDPGIAVCVSEGVEDGRDVTKQEKREAQFYFVRRANGWVVGESYASQPLPSKEAQSTSEEREPGIEVFWNDFVKRVPLQAQHDDTPDDDVAPTGALDDIAQWMNLRLELRGV